MSHTDTQTHTSLADQPCALCTTDAITPASAHAPVAIRPIFARTPLLHSLPLPHWKLNLLAVSPDARHIFIGSGGSIVVLPLSAAGVPRVIEARVPLHSPTRICVQCGEPADCRCDTCGVDVCGECTVEHISAEPAQHSICTLISNSSLPDVDSAAAEQLVTRPAEPAGDQTHGPLPRNDAPAVEALFHNLTMPADPPRAADLPGAPAELNTLRIGYVGWHPVLAATSMTGHACLFDLQRLSSLRFGHGGGYSSSSVSEADLCRLNLRPRWSDNSAWSVALSPRGSPAPVVVVGSNACRAFLWKPTDAAPAPAPPSAGAATFVPAGHNVPSVDISSCGRFVALSCIDTIVRVARLDGSGHEGECVATGEPDQLWGWSVRFIPKWTPRQRACTLQQMRQHREHTPLPDHVQRLQYVAEVGAVDPAAHNAFLERMVNQLMRQFGDHFPPAAEQALRADLRRQLVHLVRQPQPPPEDEEDEDDEAAGWEDEDEEEAAEEDEEDMPPPLDDDEEEDGDGDGDENPVQEDEDEAAMNEEEAVPVDADAAPGASASAPSVSDLPSDLLVYSSKSHLYLMDSSLKVLASLRHVCEPVMTVHRNLDRLVYVEAIPSLSCILVASSASDRVLLVRIERYACGTYHMEVEAALPHHSSGEPIRGLAVCRVPTAPATPLSTSLTGAVAEMQTRQVPRQSDGTYVPLPCPPPPLLASDVADADRFRVYILFADKQVAAFELSHAGDRATAGVASFAL